MKFTVIMNKEPKDKLDVFTKKMVQNLPEEKPSVNFSKNVMDAIYALETAKELKKSQPLISNKVWFLFVMTILAATLYLVTNTSFADNSLLSKIDLSKYTNTLSLDMNLGFTVSNITIYGFIFLAIMVSIQIGYIKNYYNSRFN
ncbi:MAG: hypothetical protein KUG51_03945 [Urechidicola sp.]|nr:hypothetical protein [Urechidicola sp.]